MCLLNEKRFCATGTIRSNRISGAPLKDGKKLKRGEVDSTFDTTNNILMCRWSDNKDVTVCSNLDQIEPMTTWNVGRKKQRSMRIIVNLCSSTITMLEWEVSTYTTTQWQTIASTFEQRSGTGICGFPFSAHRSWMHENCIVLFASMKMRTEWQKKIFELLLLKVCCWRLIKTLLITNYQMILWRYLANTLLSNIRIRNSLVVNTQIAMVNQHFIVKNVTCVCQMIASRSIIN